MRDEQGRFTIGNNDWQQRKNVGRPKAIESPEQLWQFACDYFEYCDQNPIYTMDYRGKDVTEVTFPHPMPYTWDGFDDFLFSKDVVTSLDHYRANTGNAYTDFLSIITRIDKVIKNQKFAGAAVGIFNANIIARDLGLKEKTETEHTGKDGQPLTLQIAVIDTNEGIETVST